mmetsp:Transcript_19748/g.52785  ORF Transcript_19748/g.52785 Transcript_19748/m.52785 type:complete len:206 (+) Transcript_19748:150-767(+)
MLNFPQSASEDKQHVREDERGNIRYKCTHLSRKAHVTRQVRGAQASGLQVQRGDGEASEKVVAASKNRKQNEGKGVTRHPRHYVLCDRKEEHGAEARRKDHEAKYQTPAAKFHPGGEHPTNDVSNALADSHRDKNLLLLSFVGEACNAEGHERWHCVSRTVENETSDDERPGIARDDLLTPLDFHLLDAKDRRLGRRLRLQTSWT